MYSCALWRIGHIWANSLGTVFVTFKSTKQNELNTQDHSIWIKCSEKLALGVLLLGTVLHRKRWQQGHIHKKKTFCNVFFGQIQTVSALCLLNTAQVQKSSVCQSLFDSSQNEYLSLSAAKKITCGEKHELFPMWHGLLSYFYCNECFSWLCIGLCIHLYIWIVNAVFSFSWTTSHGIETNVRDLGFNQATWHVAESPSSTSERQVTLLYLYNAHWMVQSIAYDARMSQPKASEQCMKRKLTPISPYPFNCDKLLWSIWNGLKIKCPRTL